MLLTLQMLNLLHEDQNDAGLVLPAGSSLIAVPLQGVAETVLPMGSSLAALPLAKHEVI